VLSLVQDLTDTVGSVSRHHQHSERAFNAVQAEIDAERAASLGRAGRRVEAAFARCQALLAQVDADGADDDAAAVYRTARAEFDQAMYAYLVQREAIGLPDHRAIRHAFPRPPRR
jgi:hypothetical protein